MEDYKVFSRWIEKNYDATKHKLIAYCVPKKISFDEDVFQETLVKTVEKINREGMLKANDIGFENYIFKAFKRNIAREKQYARNSKRDENIKDIGDAYENYLEKTCAMDKIKQDAFIDFAVLYCLRKAENAFDEKLVRLFWTKYVTPHMTYKKLATLTNEKNIRQKLLNIKKWISVNVSKDEILHAFRKKYEF